MPVEEVAGVEELLGPSVDRVGWGIFDGVFCGK